jgi:hypothetical protein
MESEFKDNGTFDLMDRAMSQESKRFLERIAKLEGDEIFVFASLIRDVRVPQHINGTTIGDVFRSAQNCHSLETAMQNMFDMDTDE